MKPQAISTTKHCLTMTKNRTAVVSTPKDKTPLFLKAALFIWTAHELITTVEGLITDKNDNSYSIIQAVLISFVVSILLMALICGHYCYSHRYEAPENPLPLTKQEVDETTYLAIN